MIVKKIQKLEDDPTRRHTGGAGVAEDKAMRELTKGQKIGIIGPSVRTGGNRRSTPANPIGSTPRPRHQHRRDFIGLAEYFLEGEPDSNGNRPHKDGEGRVEISASLNCQFNDKKPLTANQVRDVANWMGETAALNTRARKAASLHYVVSLPEIDNDKSTPELWGATAERMLRALSMDEHQALYVVHGDTDNRHMHVMINRVHPTKCTVSDPLRDLIKLEEMKCQIEKDFGLKIEPGRHIDPSTGKTYDWDKVRRGEIQVPRNRPRKSRVDMEKFARQVKQDLADKPFTTLTSWEELEDRLNRDGYHLRASGRGMKLCDDHGNEAKLTKIAGAGNGRQKLEDRFDCDWTFYLEAKQQGITIEQLEKNYKAEKQRQDDLHKKEIDELFAEFRPTIQSYPAHIPEPSATERKPDVSSQPITEPQAHKQNENEARELQSRLRDVVGKPWIIEYPDVPGQPRTGFTNIAFTTECEELLSQMSDQEKAETHIATKTKLHEKERSGADWLEIQQAQMALNRIEQSLKKGARTADKKNSPTETKAEPLEFDPEDPKAKEVAYRVLGPKTDKQIIAIQKVTKEALAAAKRAPQISNNAKKNRHFRAGVNQINAFIKAERPKLLEDIKTTSMSKSVNKGSKGKGRE
ncbi:relaxase/mobilization nuclease domain-containing protein [Magnetovibrio sp. PR-2]|uniref:relaxase/mobilization nuclease domain-containing protein n=1 Tax=Magnetovibrio sp. PR-2 TaxID=3120356 RepID=UPI002FCE6878